MFSYASQHSVADSDVADGDVADSDVADGGAVGASRTLAVVGGGVIGLTSALAAADAGWAVTVHDAGAQFRAASVAGGMLGSLGEGHPGEAALLDLCEQSVRRWPALVDRLADPAVMTASDSLFVATSSADAAYLDQLAGFVRSHSPRAADHLEPIGAHEIREREPGIGTRLRAGYLARGEGSVDNRQLLVALQRALGAAGGQILHGRVEHPNSLDADQILLAPGAGLTVLGDYAPLTLAKGEVLRLRAGRWCLPPPRHVIRARVDGRTVYLVPRADGIVVGATQYEGDIDEWRSGTPGAHAGGVADLLADAIEVFPGLRDYTLTEVGVGFRPRSSDGLPIISRVDERTVMAVGHGRNGIVLAPYTADAVLRLLGGATGCTPTSIAAAETKGLPR